MPFECKSFGYRVAVPQGGTNSSLTQINLVTGKGTIIRNNLGIAVNAIGYNTVDNLIYGIQVNTRNLVAIDSDGSVTNFGAVPNLPIDPPLGPGNYVAGAIDENQHLFITSGNIDRYYVVDVNQASPNFGRLLDPTAGFILETAPYGTPKTPSVPILDWSFNFIDGFLYAVQTNVAPNSVVKMNPTTGATTTLTTTGVPSGQYGSIYSVSDGFLYAVNNATGIIYRIEVSDSTATAVEFSEDIPSAQNDGASCLNAELLIDFGDAPDPDPNTTGPDNYKTLLESDGPRHAIINDLTLGTQVTSESNAYANETTDATGDDIIQDIQDDGVATPLTPMLEIETTYVLTVDVVNNTGSPANLYAWIDFNKNGIFQGNEGAVNQPIIVPSTGLQSIPLSFNVPAGVTLTPDHTFVRLRLTTDELINTNAIDPNLEDTRSIGPASDGEVEDYYLEISAVADISVEKTDNPDPVIAGNELTYEINIYNAGPSAAQNVILSDTVPPEILPPVQYSTDGGSNFYLWPVSGTLNIGTIPAGVSVTVIIKGKVDPTLPDGSIISNTSTVDSITYDPNPNNNTDTEITDVNARADISVIKDDDKDPVIAGEMITYTMTVHNAGPSVAKSVSLTDLVPLEIENPEYSLDGVNWEPWDGSINLGDMGVGEDVEVQIRGIVKPDVTGIITNTVVVDSPTPDPDPDNNTYTEETQVNASADISVVKMSNPSPVIAGEVITYTMTVHNAGPSVAKAVTLTDVVPSQILNPKYSIDGGPFVDWPNTNEINLGDMAVGDDIEVRIRGTVSQDATGNITNIVVVDSPTPDPDGGNNTDREDTPVEKSADISVVKKENEDPVIAGEVITYTMTVHNAGPSVAEDVILSDAVPVEIKDPEYSLDGGPWEPWLGSLNIGDIGAGENVVVQIRGTVNPATTVENITNIVNVESKTPDPDPDNNTDTEETQVDKSADVSVIKTSNPNPVIAGEKLTYTVTVHNAGPSVAKAVTLTDVVPPEILNPQYSIDGGSFTNWPSTNEIDLGDIGAGEDVEVLIRGIVSKDATGSMTNTVEVDSPTPDPIPSNNTDTEITEVLNPALEVIKTVDKENAEVGDILTYTIVITNTGDVTIDPVIFSDTIPSGTVLIGNQPLKNVNLGSLEPGESKTVTFQVKIVSKPCPPKLINKATVNGFYTTPEEEQRELIVESNEAVTYVGVSIFKQLSVDTNVKIPPQKPEAEDIIEVIAYVDVTYTYLIKTPVVTSYEGQELTGRKLIVEGIIRQKVVYIANEPTQSVHAAEFEIPFSTFIILPKDYKECSDIKVTGYIEDDFAKLLSDKRTIFKNITLMIEGKIGC